MSPWRYTATEVATALQPASSLAETKAQTSLILATHQLRHRTSGYACTVRDLLNLDVVLWPNKARGTAECLSSHSTTSLFNKSHTVHVPVS